MSAVENFLRDHFNLVRTDKVNIVEETQRELRKHWNPEPILLQFLIRERWQQRRDGESLDLYNYVVYIDAEGDIDWICNDDFSSQKLTSETSALIADVTNVESLPCGKLRYDERMTFKKIMGSAVVSALEGEFNAAREMKERGREYLQDRVSERSRCWSLFSATILAIVWFVVLHCFLPAQIYSEPCLFGVLGAYVSIVRNAGRRFTDANAGRFLHWSESFTRLAVGAVLGVVGVSLFQSSVSPELVRDVCKNSAGIAVVAFAAGLFDAFIPSMISQLVVRKAKEV